MPEEKKRITYYLKNELICPVCNTGFKKEELLSGGGRLIAGKLTDELRRLYEPSKKYGKINPLIYPVAVCPDCLYATYPEDFKRVPKENINKLMDEIDYRINLVSKIFGPLDFREPRNMYTGTASYILAISTYSYFSKEVAPFLKRGMSALRAAWLFDDLEKEENDQKYGYLRDIMYKKALSFYSRSLELSQRGEELFDNLKTFGPDTDKNYGYEGYLYIVSLLKFKLSYIEKDPEKRARIYAETKRILSKLYGSGKSSRSKPSVILNMVTDLYDEINNYIKEIEEEMGIKVE